MTMLCTTCMQKKPETDFYIEATGRFVARCSVCRAISDALLERRLHHLNEPPRTNVRLVQDPFIAPAVAFVIDQLRERDRAGSR